MVAVYEKLRERLDKFPQGFPATKSRVEMQIVQSLFTPEEAELALQLKPTPEKPADVAQRMGRDENHVADMLYTMSRKGLIIRWRASEKELYYWLSPWIIGIYEFQVDNLSRENAVLYEAYFKEGMVAYARDIKTPRFRVIPIEEDVKAAGEVQPYEQVSQVIESKTKFAVSECICRKKNGLLGKPCKKSHEVCMSFGPAAEYCIENGFSHEISKQSARDILREAEEQGMVHMTSNFMGSDFICNCCGCCCGMLEIMTKHGIHGIIGTSSYYAAKDMDLCTTCKTCIDRCQVNAIQLNNGHTVIKRELCIGCGLCASTCPSSSIHMVKKEQAETSHIYTNELEMVQALGRDKGKAFPFE